MPLSIYDEKHPKRPGRLLSTVAPQILVGLQATLDIFTLNPTLAFIGWWRPDSL
jgi:hypothetical protein